MDASAITGTIRTDCQAATVRMIAPRIGTMIASANSATTVKRAKIATCDVTVHTLRHTLRCPA